MHIQIKEIIERTPLHVIVGEFSFEKYITDPFKLLKNGLPFIVRNFTKVNNGNEFLKKVGEYYGSNILKARYNATPEEYAYNRKYIQISLRDYIEAVFYSVEPPPIYAAKNAIDDNVLEFFNISHPFPEYAENFRKPNLWIGPKGSTTPLHKDSTDNFSIHLKGLKRWILFSVRDVDKIGLQKTRYGNYKPAGYDFQVSLKDLEILRNEFPNYEVFVPEGSLFYLPYGWPHFVENISNSVMINYWLKPDNYMPFILK